MAGLSENEAISLSCLDQMSPWAAMQLQCRMPCLQMHHVLYEDGENEWMCLAKEAHAWVPTLPGRAYPAGLPPGEADIIPIH